MFAGFVWQTACGRTVWIDSDPSIGSPLREVDDAFALVLALGSPELRIVGISTTYGNAALHRTTHVARDLVARFGAGAGIDSHNVHAGARSARELGQRTPASDALALAVRHERKLTYVALGPLTNLATFLLLRPELANRIERVIFVGGQSPDAALAFGPRGWFRIHDANVVKDRAAAQVILRSNISLLLMPIETSSQLVLETSDLQQLNVAGTAGDYLRRKSGIWLWFWTRFVRTTGGPIFDALAIMSVTRPNLLVTETRYAGVDASGRLIAGTRSANNLRPVRFCTAFAPGTKDFILQRLQARR